MFGEGPLKKPNQEGANSAADEEPVESGVITEGAEDSLGTDEAPNYRSVEENSVTRAGPRAVGRKDLVLADVFYGGQ